MNLINKLLAFEGRMNIIFLNYDYKQLKLRNVSWKFYDCYITVKKNNIYIF